MAIRVALHHRTEYRYEKPISLGAQVVRLRPAPHSRTPILSYSLKIEPKDHFVNWQQDPQGNFQARLVFNKKTDLFRVDVDLVADMTVINPFDFFLEEEAREIPFDYADWEANELRPYLRTNDYGPLFRDYVKSVDMTPRSTNDFMVEINQKVERDIDYLIRMEPGVQTPEETLERGKGSCRDSAWLLVQLLRHLGFAARFASGYLIQLTADVKPLDGPAGPTEDFTDLHAWTEVYLPGAGWVGLDPTSGLFTGEGHIPLACTPDPSSAAPITGTFEKADCEFGFDMKLTRVYEDPRVTKPYTEDEWSKINLLGERIDERLNENDVRLTMGGEPTFVSIDDMEGAEWNSDAVGPAKYRMSEQLLRRLHTKYAPGGLLHFGQGKWYPGEQLPRWAMAVFWRKDNEPIWINPDLLADTNTDYGYNTTTAKVFTKKLAWTLGVSSQFIQPSYEDVAHYLMKEHRLPVNVDPSDSKLKDPEERQRIARIFERGLNEPVGFVLPLRRQWWQSDAGERIRKGWISGPWPTRSGHIFLIPGDSPIGLRLPVDALPYIPEQFRPQLYPQDPTAPREQLPEHPRRDQYFVEEKREKLRLRGISQQVMMEEEEVDPDEVDRTPHAVRTAMCIEPRGGRLYIFMPPTERLEDYLDLVSAIETTAQELGTPVVLEGYLPPYDPRLNNLKVTPDPGVIEVNVHPAESWKELVETTTTLYEEAHQCRLGTEKFDLDGQHTGTGGGNHIVLGAASPTDSPFLRRPDVLRSLIGFWNNHPSLSYLFSGKFIGPTSQAPRVDEGRRDSIYELRIAFSQVDEPQIVEKNGRLVNAESQSPPWLVDRIFRNILTDLTGNTHRAEFCIDKLYSPDSSSGRLGLVEFRGFEMPPHARMSLTQQLLLRGLVTYFWERPFREKLVEWKTSLHDRFLLPYFVKRDFQDVIEELNRFGYQFDENWFATHYEFRFPKIGELARDDIFMELRSAIEPWYVLGEEPTGGGTVRYVDSSVERLQVLVRGVTEDRHIITCNGRRVPMHPTDMVGESIGSVRYRAWQPPSCLHPNIPSHTPLTFDIIDRWSGRSIGGCTYHVAHPGGRNYDTFPINANEAESRRQNRFFAMGHTAGLVTIPVEERNPDFPLTLDLRLPVGGWK
ncbi:transglutaminase family protein [Calycomorphotria hydatis]|uniref:Transglutaminase-like superfamily protein n=1 Tax=Calycomorphotria hydatis TaxID=2528027 RepID=A0A517T7F4_9PLAN|nr:transglutaminase family protein [Calycomorphotria hydatis]QDT64299.1 Transglutaminase-like superfamily protein [Calycomorphotria hydatis]